MRLIHRNRAIASLPKMPRAFLTRLDMAGIAPMGWRQGPPQAIRIGRHENDVHVIGHQTPGPYLDAGGLAVVRKVVAVEGVILCAKESALPPIASLGDMIGQTGNHDACKPSHQGTMRPHLGVVIECTVTVIPP